MLEATNCRAGHRLLAAKQICKTNIIPTEVTREYAAMKYADEADILNIAMFSMTAKQWREQNPDKKDMIQDYASINDAYLPIGIWKTSSCVYQ